MYGQSADKTKVFQPRSRFVTLGRWVFAVVFNDMLLCRELHDSRIQVYLGLKFYNWHVISAHQLWSSPQYASQMDWQT